MADIINLNKVRKARAKADKEAKATQNRITFGRTKAERSQQSADNDKSARQLDGHRLECPDQNDG